MDGDGAEARWGLGRTTIFVATLSGSVVAVALLAVRRSLPAEPFAMSRRH